MKKAILFLGVILSIGFAPHLIRAQQPDSILRNRIKFISKDLNINEKDAKTVVEIFESFRSETQAVLNEKDVDPSVKKIMINKLNNERISHLSKILKSEQLAKITSVTKANPKEPSPFSN